MINPFAGIVPLGISHLVKLVELSERKKPVKSIGAAVVFNNSIQSSRSLNASVGPLMFEQEYSLITTCPNKLLDNKTSSSACKKCLMVYSSKPVVIAKATLM